MPHERERPPSRMRRWWRKLTGNRAGRAELNNFGPRELGEIARGVGASTSELRALAGKWPEAADLLTRRMAMLHLDPVEIARTEPAVSQDMTKLCSLCDNKRQCEHDLDGRAVDPGWRKYCPNSQTLMALIAGRQG